MHPTRLPVYFAMMLTTALILAACAASAPLDDAAEITADTPTSAASETPITFMRPTASPTSDSAAITATAAKRQEQGAEILATAQAKKSATQIALTPGNLTPPAWAQSITEQDIPPLPQGNLYTQDQIQEAKACVAEDATEARYPDVIPMDALPAKYEPKTACDWALLADAYAHRSLNDVVESNDVELNPIPLIGRYAYAKAISENPAYIMGSGALFVAYMGAVDLEPIHLELADIVTVEYQYHLSVSGSNVDETVLIEQGNSQPIAYTTGIVVEDGEQHSNWELTSYPSVAAVQRLKDSFTHLLPIDHNPAIQMGGPHCGEYGMGWEARLTFSDGTIITAKDTTGLVIRGGGPTRILMDSQEHGVWTSFTLFIQHSPAFLQALTALLVEANPDVEAAGWQPVGTPFCGWEFFHPIEDAFIDEGH